LDQRSEGTEGVEGGATKVGAEWPEWADGVRSAEARGVVYIWSARVGGVVVLGEVPISERHADPPEP